MNSAVTWKAIILVLLGLCSVGSLAFGFLSMLAGGMSDSPSAGNEAQSTGYIMMILGAFGIFVSIIIAILV